MLISKGEKEIKSRARDKLRDFDQTLVIPLGNHALFVNLYVKRLFLAFLLQIIMTDKIRV